MSEDMKGKRFGHLKIVREVPDYKKKTDNLPTWYLCKCDCGNIKIIPWKYLEAGSQQYCGHDCPLHQSHGGASESATPGDSRLYRIWCSMKGRTEHPDENHTRFYKGIKVCKEWAEDFEAFKEWSYHHGYHEQDESTDKLDLLSIDRIDSSKGYEPSNCQWIPYSKNMSRAAVESNKTSDSIDEEETYEKPTITYYVQYNKEDNDWSLLRKNLNGEYEWTLKFSGNRYPDSQSILNVLEMNYGQDDKYQYKFVLLEDK